MRRITLAFAVMGVSGCTSDSPVTPRNVRAMADRAAEAGLAYDVTVLPKFEGGGALSRGSAIDNGGWVAGYSTTSLGARHAALWTNGNAIPRDLGTLGVSPTLRSTVQWVGINNTGMVVGISQTDAPAPRGETWSCAPFLGAVGKICLGFAWENGAMQAMPTLGGPNGYAAGVNNRGQVVGWAETRVEGSTCSAPQVYDFHAVLWEPQRATLEDLRPYAGDAASAATAINDRGQVVGISGDCDVAVGRWSARRAVMWDHGVVVEIPNLGGAGWHTPAAINNAGIVVGFSNPPDVTDGSLKPHAFLWRPGGELKNLGVLPNSNDDNSQAFDVNARGEVVGVSCEGDACRAFVWANDVMYDLSDLVDPTFEGGFLSARSINDNGEITGNVALPNGEIRAFIATPRPRP